MMKKIIFWLIILIPIFCGAELGDIIINSSSGAIYNNLGVSVFNLDEPALQPIIFSASVENVSNSMIEDYKIIISMYWRGNLLIDEIIVRPVPGSAWASLNPGEVKYLTNREILVNQSANFSSETDLDFDEISSNNPEFEDLVAQSGLIPDGNYSWQVQFVAANDQPLSEIENISFTIQTPISIMLTTPGSPIGLDTYYSMSNRPTFVWFSNLDDFSLELYQVDSNVQSAEDIESLEPLFTVSDINRNSLTFPEDQPSLLLDRSYAWRVSAETSVPDGISSETYNSAFYLFRLMSSEDQQANQEAMVNFIQQLNIPEAEVLLNLINSGYSIDEINFENSSMTAEELMNLLNEIQSGNISFKNITIE
jgi:hypothetical protein